MRQINTATRLCAVIGNPVEHSLSPLIHNAAFEATDLNYLYVAFQVTDVPGCLTGMRALPGFRGMSVTIPHKLAVMAHLDEISLAARRVGAVNTVTSEQGRLVGSTTDGPGALRAFREAGVTLEGKRVLFLGAGGAARSVAFAVADDAQAARITILGRTQSRVAALVKDLAAYSIVPVHGGRLTDDLEAMMASAEIVVHGTPLGLFPDNMNASPVPSAMLRAEQVVFDMVYRPMRTRLIRDAEEAGCRTIPGTEMLLNQAGLQFETWTGVPAPTGVMRSALIAKLKEEEASAL